MVKHFHHFISYQSITPFDCTERSCSVQAQGHYCIWQFTSLFTQTVSSFGRQCKRTSLFQSAVSRSPRALVQGSTNTIRVLLVTFKEGAEDIFRQFADTPNIWYRIYCRPKLLSWRTDGKELVKTCHTKSRPYASYDTLTVRGAFKL